MSIKLNVAALKTSDKRPQKDLIEIYIKPRSMPKERTNKKEDEICASMRTKG